MAEIKTQNIGWILSLCQRALEANKVLSKEKLYAQMAISKGVSRKAFDEYVNILIANEDIVIDGDAILCNANKEVIEDFKKVGI